MADRDQMIADFLAKKGATVVPAGKRAMREREVQDAMRGTETIIEKATAADTARWGTVERERGPDVLNEDGGWRARRNDRLNGRM